MKRFQKVRGSEFSAESEAENDDELEPDSREVSESEGAKCKPVWEDDDDNLLVDG